ncbi:MAG: DMT family transporter [Anaerolineae bacterium]
MDSTLAAMGLALMAAAVWGAGDFSGAMATRKANPSGALVIAHGVGMLVLLLITLARGELTLNARDVQLGVICGVLIGLGLAALYRAFAVGRMSLVAPIAAVLSAIIPVLFGIFTQGLPAPIQIVGFVLAFVGIIFISRSTSNDKGHGGLGWAVTAGITIGFYFIVMQQINAESLFVPLTIVRVVSSALMLVFAFVGYRSLAWIPKGAALPLAALAGVMDITGSALYVLAGEQGQLSVVAMLAALYPASTVLLARLILKEQTNRTQNISIVAIMLAIALVTIGKP